MSIRSAKQRLLDKMTKTEKEWLSLEKQYAETLGRMAQLCDTVCPWVLSCPPELVPIEVAVAAADIMEYVNAVRPEYDAKAHEAAYP